MPRWIPYLVERMEHYYEVGVERGRWPYRAKKRPLDYVRGGNVVLRVRGRRHAAPYCIDLVGEDRFIYAWDTPTATASGTR